MRRPHHDLHSLLAQLDPQADLAHRHPWLIAGLDWVRGNGNSAPDAVGRLYLAFQVALSAQNVSGVARSRIYAAIGARLRSHPLDFFRPRAVVV